MTARMVGSAFERTLVPDLPRTTGGSVARPSSVDEVPAAPRGLPGPLPEGEAILWQGSPRFRSFLRHALHARLIAAYFGVLGLWRAAEGAAAGETAGAVAGSVAFIAALGLAVLALFALYAWLVARTTVYTITTRRIALTFGIALPVTLNLPLKLVGAADVRLFKDGAGDIPLTVAEGKKLSRIVLWPHLRTWNLSRVQPMMRSVPDAAEAAETLCAAWNAAQAEAPPAATRAGTAPAPHDIPDALRPAAA